jgi:HTH-type transcriptional regulator, sugar sensing transcriptional regulator
MEREEVLRNLGFSKKEIQVYLALLSLGASPVTKIAKKSKTFRTYTYDILEELVKKGVVSSYIKRGTRFFETTEPTKLLGIVKEREQQVKSILPGLESLKGSAVKKPDLEFYEGKEGIKTLMERIIREKPKELLVIANAEKQREVMGFYFDQYLKQRIKNKIKTRVLAEKSKYSTQKIKKTDKQEFRETRFLPEKIKEAVVKYVYNDTVTIISFEPNIVGMSFTDKNITAYERKVFEILWSQTK